MQQNRSHAQFAKILNSAVGWDTGKGAASSDKDCICQSKCMYDQMWHPKNLVGLELPFAVSTEKLCPRCKVLVVLAEDKEEYITKNVLGLL